MSQLACTFKFVRDDALDALSEDNLWSFGLPLPAFFDQALSMPGFETVRTAGATPVRLEISYSDV